MTQTAVEWLQEQLKDGVKYNPLEKNGYSNAEQRLFEQANVMFEEQIKLAFTQGELFSGDFYDPNNPNIDCSENYYNETYNQ
jgi:hypothetical protein